jgi:hypothetical protein
MGQTCFDWPDDDETQVRRPARQRPVAAGASLTLLPAPTPEQRETQREMLADALAEALWAELCGSVTTPVGSSRTEPKEDDTRG